MSSSDSTARRILIAYAHPDDETFGLGATIGHYVDTGVEVHLICATNGDAGEVDPQFLDRFDSIADLRLHELACAVEMLGIHQVYTFGYRDSGMMGTPDNDHPDSLWQADQNEVARRVVEVMRRVRPQVIITFDPFGGYGHPDHIAIHKATLQAYHEAGDPEKYPEQIAAGLEPFQPSRLYYSIFPRGLIRAAVWITRLMGQDPRHMGRNKDLDFQAVLDATLPIHVRLDSRRYYDLWQDASACHASQGSPRAMVPLPRAIARQFFGWQTFYQAEPALNGSGVQATDLFAGIK